ncbi:radical SAM protein [bacterium]|nr:radical SAM protein [bacterium]
MASPRTPKNARDNRLLNTLESRSRATVLRSRPYSIQLEVTTKCNFACIMCARDKYHGRGENLEDDILNIVFRDIMPYTQDMIVSSFGEPLLFPRMPEIFQHIDKSSGIDLGFYTNFVLMTEEMAELIIRSGVAYVNASIDGASKQSYEKIRVGGKWDILTEKLRMFQQIKKKLKSDTPRVNLCVVGSTENIHETETFVEMAREFGFDTLKYNHNMYVDEEHMDYLTLVHEKEKTVRQFRRGFRRALELGVHSNFSEIPFKIDVPEDASERVSKAPATQVLMNRIKRELYMRAGFRMENTWYQSGKTAGNFAKLFFVKTKDYIGDRLPAAGVSSLRRAPNPHHTPNDAPPRTCGNAWNHVHVKSDGLVYPCCFSDEVMGDLRKQSFEQIWNGPKYQDLRESLTSGQYWDSCRKASCNWVDGANSMQYGARIDVLQPITTIDGSKETVLPVRVLNQGKLPWLPKSGDPQYFTSLSYRLFNEKLELIDEGPHVSVPKAVNPGEMIFMDLPIKKTHYAGKMILKLDMVHENTTWFGERGNNSTEIPIEVTNVPFALYLGSWKNAHLRAELEDKPLTPGQRLTLPIRVTNVGTGPIGKGANHDNVSYHWRDEDSNGDYSEWEGLRTEIPTLAPGEHADLEVEVEVPKHLPTGRHRLVFDVIRADEAWLSVLWNRPLLSYPVRIARAPEEAELIPRTRRNGKPYTWEPRGQCVNNTGNKGVW